MTIGRNTNANKGYFSIPHPQRVRNPVRRDHRIRKTRPVIPIMLEDTTNEDL